MEKLLEAFIAKNYEWLAGKKIDEIEERNGCFAVHVENYEHGLELVVVTNAELFTFLFERQGR